MEELQSTEILDREILEDARKKAWRILKSADESVKAQSLDWEKKIKEDMEELKCKYKKRTDSSVSEIISRLPMEKRRIKAQALDIMLTKAVMTWYSGHDRKYILKLLENYLKVRVTEYGNFSGKVFFSGLSQAEAEEILHNTIPQAQISIGEVNSADIFPVLVIDNMDVRIRASIRIAVDFLLLNYRTELISALVGNEISDNDNFSLGFNTGVN
jgi:vacuolar-type H+-ATPase subunit H